MRINLPPRSDLAITGEDDPLKYYYLPVAGIFYRKRLKDVLTLLGEKRYENLLEIGFGSGIFFPELSKRCRFLHGLEAHNKIKDVNDSLGGLGIKADLKQGDILNTPYGDNFFDAVVSVSTLEHIKDLERASDEIVRILKPGGTAVFGFPARNKLTDFIFKIYGRDPGVIHPSSDTDISGMFGRKMKKEAALSIPGFLPRFLSMYFSVKYSKKST